jgi:hypothetical protein
MVSLLEKWGREIDLVLCWQGYVQFELGLVILQICGTLSIIFFL